MNLPSELVDAFRENRAAIFVGAGASMAAGLPSWDELISQLAHELTITLPPAPLSQDILLKIPQYFVNRSDSRRDLMRRIENLLKAAQERFRKTKPLLLRPVHHYLAQLPSRLYYTTNLDTFLEDELTEQGIEVDVIHSENTACQFSERRRCQVRKIHGSTNGGDWNDVVLTRSDYARLPHTRPIIFRLSQRICGWERTKHPTYEVREQRRSYARMRSRGG
jgi:hypothetical protein